MDEAALLWNQGRSVADAKGPVAHNPEGRFRWYDALGCQERPIHEQAIEEHVAAYGTHAV